jgi:hypothetical protein
MDCGQVKEFLYYVSMFLDKFVESFLGNRSVAAFLGAFFAFCLVVLNDRRRDSKMVENIDNEIANARDLARQKSKTAENNLKSMNENRGYSGRVIAFDTALVREMKGRVLHLLDPEKRQVKTAAEKRGILT